jgi:hypothetical protein
MRQSRLLAMRRGLPGSVWRVLFFGGLIVVSCTYFFMIESLRRQLLLTALVSITLALVLYIGVSLNYAFSGSSAIDADPLKRLLEHGFHHADKVYR